MMYPPSLPPDVRDGGFVADNGELGILLSDTQAFLNACRADNLTVFGWELWIIDYEWGKDNAPVPEAGSWCGGIPLNRQSVPAVVGGTGDVDQSENELAVLNLTDIAPEWLKYIRVNFTLFERP